MTTQPLSQEASEAWQDVKAWAQERLENTERIAATKTGEDRDGWVLDGVYWKLIVAALEARAADAQQAQWQQKAMRYLRHEPDCHISIARMTLFDPACHANGLCSCGLVQLAALTAQQETPK